MKQLSFSLRSRSLGIAAALLLASSAFVSAQDAVKTDGDAEKGKEVFEQCSVCHNMDTDEKKMGPSVKGLFKKEKMTNGKKPTHENVLAVINAGGNGMPAYDEMLSAEEKANLLAYLKTL